MIQHKTVQLEGASNQKFSADISYSDTNNSNGTIIFCHGFKGFKDWGCWQLVANYFVENGFSFLKFNFSHNGMGLEDSVDFDQLDKFATNTLNKEMEDIKSVEDFILNDAPKMIPEMNTDNLYCIGHSKGGVSALLYVTNYETKIKKVVTWASPFDFYRNWSAAFFAKWKADGVQYIKNGRTKQMMPLHLEILEDYEANKEKYSLKNASKKLQVPYLIIQGTNDEAVKMEEAHLLKKYFTKAKLHIIEGANHVFGGSHPYSGTELPEHSKELIAVTKAFFLD